MDELKFGQAMEKEIEKEEILDIGKAIEEDIENPENDKTDAKSIVITILYQNNLNKRCYDIL